MFNYRTNRINLLREENEIATLVNEEKPAGSYEVEFDATNLTSGKYVYTEPEILAASDTADVIIKKRNADGTLEDFPPGQTFELAVTKGCVDGNILVGDSVGVYFADVQQPIKFVTADSLESDSGFVRLRVGTDVSAFTNPVGNIKGEEEKRLTERKRELIGGTGYSRAELRAGFEKMIKGKKAEGLALKNKTGEEPPVEAPIIGACYFGGSSHPVYWEGDVKYEVGGCEDISTEHSEINYFLLEQPEFFKVPHSDFEELKLVELIQVCVDESGPEQTGGSIPVDYKRYRYDYNANSFLSFWELKPYKGLDNRVHYYFINPQTNEPTPLFFDFVTGVCYLKINPPGDSHKTLIEEIADVNDPNIIPSQDADQAFADFCGFRCYPTEVYKYELIEIIRIHEREHMNDFEDIIIENFPLLAQEIESYSDLCQSYSEEVRENAEKVIYTMIDKFIRDAKNQYNEISNIPTELDHERQIQGRETITRRVEDYKDALKLRFPQLIGEDCQKCSYE